MPNKRDWQQKRRQKGCGAQREKHSEYEEAPSSSTHISITGLQQANGIVRPIYQHSLG
jgi:hypothetical protein